MTRTVGTCSFVRVLRYRIHGCVLSLTLRSARQGSASILVHFYHTMRTMYFLYGPALSDTSTEMGGKATATTATIINTQSANRKQALMAFEIVERTDFDHLYSLGSAYGDSDSPYLQLFEAGCGSQATGWKCTKACLDISAGPTLLLGSANATYTLQNCLVFPIVASMLAAGNLTAHGVQLAQKYGIEANHTSQVDLSWPVILDCVFAFCGSTQTSGCKNYSDAGNWTATVVSNQLPMSADSGNFETHLPADAVHADFSGLAWVGCVWKCKQLRCLIG